jgi:hypothetical protein
VIGGHQEVLHSFGADNPGSSWRIFPPMVAAKAMLGDHFGEMREHMVDVWRRRNEATDGRLLAPQEYLLSIVRL